MSEAKMTKAAGKPIWPKIPAPFVRAVLAGHSALGLAFAALIYLVCFSGTAAVFAREFQRWEQAAGPVITSVKPSAVQAVAEAAMARAGGTVDNLYIYMPTPDLPRLSVMTVSKGMEASWLADGEGRLVGATGEPVFTHFMTHLHINLHLPQTWGIFVVGLTGVALLSSLISGVLAHPRVFKDAFHLRWGGQKRLQEADLHNRMGVWALPFHVVISMTGALLGLTTVIVGVLGLAVFKGDVNKVYDLFLPPHPPADARPAPLVKVSAALEATARLAPGSYPSFVGVQNPSQRGQGVLVNAALPNRLVAADAFTFDGDGKLIEANRSADTTLGEKILGSLGVLHFGWFGGLPIKIVYGFLGVALTAVTASGVAIWLARRRDKGRPAPTWERIWIATVWSQPIAFPVAAVVALVAPASEAAPLIAWLAATLVVLATAVTAAPAALSRGLRALAALLLAAAAAAHVARFAASGVDPAAWGVDVALMGLAAGLALTVLRRKPAAG